MNPDDLTHYLDQYLKIDNFSDASLNGLQVENNVPIKKIGLAVDACLEAILLATQAGCNLLIVHHGIFWGGPVYIRSYIYKRIRALIQADMALYTAHLPLDAHQEVGNNIQVAKGLELTNRQPFGYYHGVPLGVQGNLDSTIHLDEAIDRCQAVIGPFNTVLRFGSEKVASIGIITGSASDPEIFEQAHVNKIDLLITGEPKQAAYSLAQEFGLNIFYGGHYRTETFGLKALGGHLTERFDLPVQFIETVCPF